VTILIGQGARTAAAQVQRVADTTGAGVAKALLGKDVLSDDLPYVTGAIGLLGTRPSYELMRDCDTLLIVGSNFPYSQFLPKYGAARAVQVDIDGSAIGMRYPTELNIVADAASALDTLIPLLKEKHDRSWRTTVENNVSDWWETLERQSMLSAKPANPMRIVWELSQRLPHNAIVTADSGSSTNWYARCLRFTDGVRGSVSGTLATMGCAVPYAIGAKFARPDRPVIALVGDGAMQMNAMAELLTIRRFSQQWKDPRLIVCVFHNNDLNQVTWELRAMGGAPKFEPSQSLPDVSYAEVANAMGISGIDIDRDDDIGPAWDRALAADGPTVLDIRCDPEMPPIPPHATYEQIKELTTAILKGDPEALHLMYQGAKDQSPGVHSAPPLTATKPANYHPYSPGRVVYWSRPGVPAAGMGYSGQRRPPPACRRASPLSPWRFRRSPLGVLSSEPWRHRTFRRSPTGSSKTRRRVSADHRPDPLRGELRCG